MGGIIRRFLSLGRSKTKETWTISQLKEGERTNESIHHSAEVRQENLAYIPPPCLGVPSSQLGEMEKELMDKIWGVI